MKMAKILTAEEILGAQDVQFETVNVPEWGGDVKIRSMDSFAVLRFTGPEKRNDAASLVVALSVCDESGELVFKESDVAKLKAKCVHAIMRISKAALRLNGLDQTEIQAKEEVESAKKD
jgi:hypothetical protein